MLSFLTLLQILNVRWIDAGMLMITQCSDLNCCDDCEVTQTEILDFDGLCRSNGEGLFETRTCHSGLHYTHRLYISDICAGPPISTVTSGRCYTHGYFATSHYYQCDEFDMEGLLLGPTKSDDDVSANGNAQSYMYIIASFVVLLVFFSGLVGGYLVHNRRKYKCKETLVDDQNEH